MGVGTDSDKLLKTCVFILIDAESHNFHSALAVR